MRVSDLVDQVRVLDKQLSELVSAIYELRGNNNLAFSDKDPRASVRLLLAEHKRVDLELRKLLVRDVVLGENTTTDVIP